MEREEFKILAKGMKAVYTQPTFLPDADAFNVWYSLLQDIDYQVAQTAIKKYMLTNKFPPTIADIREYATTICTGEQALWSDGWEEVIMAIRRHGSYNEEKALESMSDITRQCVKRLGYQNLCRSESIEVDRANFRMIYEQIANREHEKAKLPQGMQQLIASVQKNLIESKGEGDAR